MKPGGPAWCSGHVWHQRTAPRRRSFTRRVQYVWLDPDDPNALGAHSRWWSSSHVAPLRFRAIDYGDGSDQSLRDQVLARVGRELNIAGCGSVRMLTQVRRWGWLFNPITAYVVWDGDDQAPVAAVLEVTNTPWKERHHYAVELVEGRGRVPKVLHVSPFLDESGEYHVAFVVGNEPTGRSISLAIDLVVLPDGEPIVRTEIRVTPTQPSRSLIVRQALRAPAATFAVSVGIHVQAMVLFVRRIPFVSHPSKRLR